MIQMLRNLLRPLFHDEIQQLQDELMKSYKAHWDEQERHQTCEQLLEESLRRINELEKHVSIYEHAEKFSKSTPDILRERMLSLSNEAIDIICEYLLFYKTDYILSNHKIKMEKNTNEYIRWAVSSIDVMNSLIRWCKKTSEHKDKITGKIEQNKKTVENN